MTDSWPPWRATPEGHNLILLNVTESGLAGLAFANLNKHSGYQVCQLREPRDIEDGMMPASEHYGPFFRGIV